MRRGRLRSRGYATLWTPDEAGRSWVPPPYDLFLRRRRGEAVVTGNSTRPAYRCDACGAVVIAPEQHADER